MAVPKELECALVQDLLVPYVADDVRPVTRAFVEAHVSRCSPCHTALTETAEAAGATVQVPPPVLPADPGQKVVNRVRRNMIVLIGVLVLCVALTAGSIFFGIGALRKLAGMPATPPVPPAGLEPATVASLVDLSRLGLKQERIETSANGVRIPYYTDGKQVTLAFQRFESEREAARAFHAWNNSFRVRTMAVEFNTPSGGSARLRSQGSYHYGWNRDVWFVTIKVPESVPEAATLRDQIFTALQAAFPG